MDRLPPHNIEAEQALVGSLLLDRDTIPLVADWVPPEAFYHGANGVIFRAMLGLWKVRRPCDLVTLIDLLTARSALEKAGGVAYITSLLTVVPTAAHAEHYAAIVMTHYRDRTTIDAGAELVAMGYRGEATAEDSLAFLREKLEPIRLTPQQVGGNTIPDLIDNHIERTTSRWDGRLPGIVVPTGIWGVDRLLHGGMRTGELIYIGGRPGSGKTSLALQMAKIAAKRTGRLSLVVELEMTQEAIINRMIAAQANVPFSVAYDMLGDVEKRERWLSATDALREYNIAIEGDLRTTAQIANYIERVHVENPIGAVYIDHIDHLSDPDLLAKSPTERIGAISKRLRQLTRNVEPPIVALAQLNRQTEEHPPFRPSLNNFKNSGAVEEDADLALLIYRRHYYVARGDLESSATEDYVDGVSNRQKVECIVAKNRNGEVDMVPLGWEPETMSFHAA